MRGTGLEFLVESTVIVVPILVFLNAFANTYFGLYQKRQEYENNEEEMKHRLP